MPAYAEDGTQLDRHSRTMSVLEEIYHPRAAVDAPDPDRAPRRRHLRVIHWERLAPALTLAVGIAALGVGALQMRGTLGIPLSRLNATTASAPLADLSAQVSESFAAALASADDTRDTDRDGLADAVEARYGTSAYLEDSDSDGQLDGNEVAAGSDPACPAGQTCSPAGGVSASPQPAASPLPRSSPAGFGSSGEPLGPSLSGNGSAAAALGNLDDAPLGSALQDQLGRLLAPSGGGRNAGAGDGAPATSIPPAKLRELLRQYGVPEEVLEQYTDVELQQIATEVSADLSNE